MALIEWKDEMSVKVEQFDRDHQKLVGMINRLHEAMLTRQTQQVLGSILGELTSYTRTHFAAEEAWMSRLGYPRLALQQTAHRQFVEKVEDLRKQHGEGRVTLGIATMDFLRDWWTRHIAEEDKRYGEFFLGSRPAAGLPAGKSLPPG